jgi:hypothetical protein
MALKKHVQMQKYTAYSDFFINFSFQWECYSINAYKLIHIALILLVKCAASKLLL